VWSRLLAAGLGGASAALACAGLLGPPPSPARAYLEDPAALERGKLLFTGSCGGYCHPTKPANRDAPYLFDCNWKSGGSDAEIFISISSGIPDTRMLGYGGKLPERDADIWRLIAYIRSASNCKY
jgi:mono/diheme cytochrome c family protein